VPNALAYCTVSLITVLVGFIEGTPDLFENNCFKKEKKLCEGFNGRAPLAP
jgi:hypothetical protein